MAVVASAAVEQAHAAWVGAGGSIVAVLVAVAVFAINISRERKRQRAVIEETKQTIVFLADRCIEEYEMWSTSVQNADRGRFLEETISLRHLDVPLERLLPAHVGNHKYNRALIELRKVNADVFIQIEKAKTLLKAADTSDPAAELKKVASKLDEFVRRARATRLTLTD